MTTLTAEEDHKMRQGMLKEVIADISKRLTDQGKIIEAGWIGLRFMSIPLDAPDIQVEEMRNSFFAGAQHLFTSIMTILDPGTEPTDKDLERMGLIDKELKNFIKIFSAKNIKTQGTA